MPDSELQSLLESLRKDRASHAFSDILRYCYVYSRVLSKPLRKLQRVMCQNIGRNDIQCPVSTFGDCVDYFCGHYNLDVAVARLKNSTDSNASGSSNGSDPLALLWLMCIIYKKYVQKREQFDHLTVQFLKQLHQQSLSTDKNYANSNSNKIDHNGSEDETFVQTVGENSVTSNSFVVDWNIGSTVSYQLTYYRWGQHNTTFHNRYGYRTRDIPENIHTSLVQIVESFLDYNRQYSCTDNLCSLDTFNSAYISSESSVGKMIEELDTSEEKLGINEDIARFFSELIRLSSVSVISGLHEPMLTVRALE